MIKYKYVAQKEVRPIYMYSFKLNPFDILKKKKSWTLILNIFQLKLLEIWPERSLNLQKLTQYKHQKESRDAFKSTNIN